MEDNSSNMIDVSIDSASDYEIQSEINDMKQHANKIIQGIKKLDNNDANRAIWELFQNAVDLSDECKVHIKLTESSFEFSHNGEPFTPMTLDCLFKQVSSKTLEEKKQLYEGNDPIGQYGTGFIATHSFGKELIIEGALIKGDGYVPLNQFVINRYTENWRELAERIRNLKRNVIELLNSNQINNKPFPNTTFSYNTTTKYNFECARKALISLRLMLPYVMTLNPKLVFVSVTDIDGTETIYKKKDSYVKETIHVRPISINGIVQEICYLQTDQEKVIIILPISSDFEAFDFDENLPRLFLYYPLIGTQNFGINFIINSRQFQPTEPRNGLYLKSDNDLNQKDEAANTALIQIASDAIFDFITTNYGKILNPIKLSSINFTTTSDDAHLNEYFQELKNKWIIEFKNFPLVETDAGNIRPSETCFFHQELLFDEASFDAIYNLSNQFWKNIPKKHLVKEWTRKIEEWNVEETNHIRIKDIVEKIQESATLQAFNEPDNLKTFYTYIIEQENSGLFNDYKLLPNINGELRHLTGNQGLNSSINLPKDLIEIAEVIMPDIPKRHVNPDFKFSLEFNDYSRKNYTIDINEFISKQVNDKSTSDNIPQPFLQNLIKYCKVTTSFESNSVPTKMMKLICKYYDQDNEMITIPSVKDDELDIRSPQKRLLRVLLNDISSLDKNWITNHLDFLKEIISTGGNYDSYEEMFLALRIFPNQLHELKEQVYLKIDDNIPEEIKNLYDTVVKPDYPIRSNLVHPDFADYLKTKQKKTITDLTEKIESEFFKEENSFTINEHPFKKEILSIIEKIKVSPEYAKYFKLIFSKRSTILVELADGEDTFSILSLNPNKIKKLANLSKIPDFEKIIQLGQSALMRIQQEESSFKYKYYIGTLVERIIRERLSHIIGLKIQKPNEISEVSSEIQTADEQNGQDIVIYLNENPIYFIEVKSRWNENTPFRISKRQTITAFEKMNCYSLISIDMTESNLNDKFAVKDISEIQDVIRVNTDIGKKIDRELVDLYGKSSNADTIHLDGDFRTYIPLNYIKTGITLDAFEIFLIKEIQRNYDK